jgi:hypothetical protein
MTVPARELSRDEIAAAEREAESFLRQNQGHLRQPVSIYRLSEDGLSGSAQPSTDGNLLADEIAHRKEPRWVWKTPEVAKYISTFNLSRPPRLLKPLHSLLALGSIAVEQRRRPARKLMFWLGPGWQFEGNESRGPCNLRFSYRSRHTAARSSDRLRLFESPAVNPDHVNKVHANPKPGSH